MRDYDEYGEPVADDQVGADYGAGPAEPDLTLAWPDDDVPVTEQEETWSEDGSDWDDNADDELVFDGDKPRADRGRAEPVYDDNGVVWDDGDDDADLDDISITPGATPGPQVYGSSVDVGPEVELAGRRDVRPRAPRRGAPPGEAPATSPRSRHAMLDDEEDEEGPLPQQVPGEPHFARTEQVARTGQAANRGSSPGRPAANRTPEPSQRRFARTQAAAGDTGPAPIAQGNRRTPSLRRQPQPTPYKPNPKKSRLRGPLIAGLFLALFASGGLLVAQSFGGVNLGGFFDNLPFLSGPGRTAADTPFGATVPPEEALANLSDEENASSNGASSPVQEPVSPEQEALNRSAQANDILDSLAARNPNGPPIPKFKPLESPSRAITLNADAASDEAVEADEGSSMFDWLKSYF